MKEKFCKDCDIFMENGDGVIQYCYFCGEANGKTREKVEK